MCTLSFSVTIPLIEKSRSNSAPPSRINKSVKCTISHVHVLSPTILLPSVIFLTKWRAKIQREMLPENMCTTRLLRDPPSRSDQSSDQPSR